MRILPVLSRARRIAVLIVLVVAADDAAVFLIAKLVRWCAIIPTLIPTFTPMAIFSYRVPTKS